jgi:hypothetical protein
MSDTAALVALERMDPLPAEFAPARKDALTKAPDSMTADSYRLLLSHVENLLRGTPVFGEIHVSLRW